MNRLSLSEIRQDRNLLLIGLILYAAWGYIYTVTIPGSNDPLIYRFIGTSILLLVYILSFGHRFTIKNFTVILYGCVYLVTVQQIVLAYLNEFTSEFLIIYIVLVFTLSPYFKTPLALGSYLLFAFILTFTPVIFDEGKYEVSPSFFISSVFTILALVYPILNGRLRIQERLVFQKTLMDSIFNGVSDSLILVNPEDLTVIDCNDCTYRMFGMDRINSLKSTPLKKILCLPLTKEFDEEIRVSLSEKGVYKYECEQVGARGKKFWTDIVTTSITSTGKKLWLFRLTDITERKNAEKELNKKSEQLLRKNEELGQFAYVASHDLKEPLRTVTSYLQLLEKRYSSSLDQAAKDFITYAVNGAVRMHALINDLLTFSRVEVDHDKKEVIDLNNVVSRILQDISSLIEQSEGKLEVPYPLPEVKGDFTLFTQLFANLITNGIKYRRKDVAPVVQILFNDEKDYYKFIIRDNGIGISPEFREKVFIIFQRLHSREEYAGTGIGLAICKKIVDIYGGKIWIESNQNGGADFIFTIKKQS